MRADDQVVLLCVNFLLPEGDYRVAYASRADEHTTIVAAPERPRHLPDEQYAEVGIAEGLGARDVRGVLQLLRVLVRLRRRVRTAFFYSTKLILIGPLLCRLLGIPSVAIVTGRGRVHDADTLVSRLLRPIYKVCFALAARCASRVAFQNSGHAASFTADFPRLTDKAVVVRSALALPSEPLAPRLPDGTLRVVCVARLLPSKGIDDFLAVADALADDPVDFVLVGGRSPGQDALYARVLEAHRGSVITYRGRLSSEEVHAAYADAHVLFLPSYGEGLARVFLEAAHFGLLPIGYDIDGNRDILTEGAQIVPVGSVGDVSQALKAALSDPVAVEHRARSFQEHVAREYSVSAYLEAMDHLVGEVQQ